MSNICSFSMENTHNNVEFGVLQKTSKQSLISILFNIGRGDTPLPYPPPGRNFVPRSRLCPCLHKLDPPPHPKFPRSAPDHTIIFDTKFSFSLAVGQGSCQACNLLFVFFPSANFTLRSIRSRICAAGKTRVFGLNSPLYISRD